MSAVAFGPERLEGQGIGPDQYESAAEAISRLLTHEDVAGQVDLVALYRHCGDGDPEHGAYEIWSHRGMVRFARRLSASGALGFEVLEVVGENPVAAQSEHALRTIEEEMAAARRSGFPADDPARRFIAPEAQSYPFAYERVAQLFDSPHAPDLAVSPRDWCFGIQPGTHGALHVRQARAPLWLSGPGVAVGEHDLALRAVDIAPTALAALGFPLIDGRDASGRTSTERGREPDVLLRRQDGRIASEVLDPEGPAPRYLYLLLLDGLHATELEDRMANGSPDELPALRRLRERAAVLRSGSIVNFPSITWPSHTCIATGTWCGHHDVVNPSYYLRDKRETVSPQGQEIATEGFANPEVESLYEAFSRVRGDHCMTAAIFAPFGRGARHAALERRNLCDKKHLRALNESLRMDEDPRWQAEGAAGAARESALDTRGMAQVIDLFTNPELDPPDFVFHELILTDGVGHDFGPHGEGIRAALDESDRRIGRVIELLDAEGRFDETLFVLTADHGMAPQDTSLAANPGRHIKTSGMAAIADDSMIWLLDLQVEIERHADGRSARLIVRELDALPSGQRPPVEGASVEIRTVDGDEGLTAGRTGPGGVFGFATPAELTSAALYAHVEAPGFNPRRVRLDATPIIRDLRAELYGRAACPA